MSFALDQLEKLNASDPTGRFTARLDLNELGVFGHSLGGATALQFCHDDPRCKAGVDIDGAPLGSALTDGVKQQFLFLLSDHSREPTAETAPIVANLQSIYDRLPENQRLWILLRANERQPADHHHVRLPQYVLRRIPERCPTIHAATPEHVSAGRIQAVNRVSHT
jgi:pimeloyl-ACP methyl ester carboxylesterase